MIMDSEASGAQIVFGDKYKFKLFASNYRGTEYQFAEFYNDRAEKFNFVLGYHRMHRDGYRDIATNPNGYYDSSMANIFSAGLKYNFDKNFAIGGSFSQNFSGKIMLYRRARFSFRRRICFGKKYFRAVAIFHRRKSEPALSRQAHE